MISISISCSSPSSLCFVISPGAWSWCGGTHLEAVEIRVEHVSTLDVGDQSHCQLFIGLISDIHHGGYIYREAIHP